MKILLKKFFLLVHPARFQIYRSWHSVGELEAGHLKISSAIALREAIETAVYNTILEGKEKAFGSFNRR